MAPFEDIPGIVELESDSLWIAKLDTKINFWIWLYYNGPTRTECQEGNKTKIMNQESNERERERESRFASKAVSHRL